MELKQMNTYCTVRYRTYRTPGQKTQCTVRGSVSVADPGCLFRIPDPDFLSIPDPGSKNSNKREGGG
jgi:hypothetical protein